MSIGWFPRQLHHKLQQETSLIASSLAKRRSRPRLDLPLCSRPPAIRTLTQATGTRRSMADYRTVFDVPYVGAPHRRRRLDLYLPPHASPKSPLLVFIHGAFKRSS